MKSKYSQLIRFEIKNEDLNSESKFVFRCNNCGAEYRRPMNWNPIGTSIGYCMKCHSIWEGIKIEE